MNLHAGGRPKKFARHKLPPIDASNSGVYESLDAEYNGIPLDYTYPTPSPTAKYDPEKDTAYSYIPNNGSSRVPSLKKVEPKESEKSKNPKNIYHSIGPDVVQHYEFENTNGVAGGAAISKGAVSGSNGTNHGYHYLTAESDIGDFGNGVVVYEDPTLPRFRVSI